ncbi:S8/S53 family peptidase [Nocardioides sp.]|uniref:S8 family peptidase n=1 Tax=Nocardioides sp. TaxID=35761 RepID=UPI002ED4B346
MRLGRLAVAGVVAVLAAPAAPGWASAGAAEAVSCANVDAATERSATTTPSVPLELLGVDRATELLGRRGVAPGEGVRVAIVDSGVNRSASPMAPVTVVERVAFGVGGPVVFGQGTNLAGLVAGGDREDGQPTGVAPAAEIVDLRVYAKPLESGALDVPTDNVLAAVRWLVDNAESERLGVVVMGFDVEPSRELERAMRDLTSRDVVVVAATGDRPAEGQPGFEDFGGGPTPGEDAAGTVQPAAYDGVLGVTTTAGGVTSEAGSGDAAAAVLLSSDVDVAVPSYGAVTLAPNGATCAIDPISSVAATGIAAGVVALVRSAYPDENAAQIVARLTATASGVSSAPTTATGAGVLQPVEALTRKLDPDESGAVDDMPRAETAATRVTAPTPQPDPVAGALDDARWWGLLAGGALVVALLARPLLSRRQRSD